MEKINPIQRMVRSLSDFSFSNRIIEEKGSKAFGYFMFSFMLFVLIGVIWSSIFIKPQFNAGIDQVEDLVKDLPNFTIDNGILNADDTSFNFYSQTDIRLVYDLEDTLTNMEIMSQYKDAFVLRRDGLYYENQSVILFNTFITGEESAFYNLTKDNIIDIISYIDGSYYPIMIVLIIILFVFLLVLSLINWVITVVINGFVNQEVLTGQCYKLALYAMFPANLLMVLQWFLGINIPMFTLIYVGITGFYAFKYLKAYEPQQTIDHIYE